MDFDEPSPDEMVERYRNHRKAGRTIHEEQKKEMEDLFYATASQAANLIQELTTEQIKVFSEIVEQSSDGSGFANIIRGLCMGELVFKRGLLPNGASYEDMFAKEFAAAEKAAANEPDVSVLTAEDLRADEPAEIPAAAYEEEPRAMTMEEMLESIEPTAWERPEDYLAYLMARDPIRFGLYETWNVEPQPTPDGEKLTERIVCKGCGVMSISLEDRMLRPPGVEGCGKCKDKAKWG